MYSPIKKLFFPYIPFQSAPGLVYGFLIAKRGDIKTKYAAGLAEEMVLWGADNSTPSNSSFNQRRAQILSKAFELLFHDFMDLFHKDNAANQGELAIVMGSSFETKLPAELKENW